MSAPVNSDVTLLTEHLTYRPALLINILAFRATEAVEKGLLAADPADIGFRKAPNAPDASEAESEIRDKAQHEIENGVHQLETLLEAKIDKNFDKLELYALRNILSVPPDVRDWVRLSHYEGLNFAPDEDAPDVERDKMENGDEGEKPYPAFAFLQDKGELTGDAQRPVTTTTSFTLSQLPALKAILANLQPRLEKLSTPHPAINGEAEKSWRSERVEFVENETRKHLENVRGLELGDMGEIRDGDWQGEGRKIGKQEVEDLEAVVGMVNGKPNGKDTDEQT
ncbi:putative Kinetochore-associated protein MTW1 [Glarea lozoyensis 74030]|uniref:Putative Kinetochore-associated protein MTW1 n=1 Tax=Glarea lozoyensis (strain ATCC 74030 / MF5533) TaxID=1104152 RepID=H0EMA2_GLAL7|nr:putative Kinetochore-associated protein MTW1 [Glarea lozoyensis 74030]